MIVQVARLRDGSRKVISVTEVVGMESDVITTQEVMHFAQHGLDKEGNVIGNFVANGIQPTAMQRFEEFGVYFDIKTLNEMGAPVACNVGIAALVVAVTGLVAYLNWTR